MIIRKPYAFLIKNFKKIHIVLLLLSLFVAYKLFDVTGFIQEFMKLGTYDLYADPITNHISTLLLLSVFILVIGSGALILLLRYKKKPWKTYLVPFIEYLALFFVLRMIKNFFGDFTDDVETTDLRLSRDLLYMFIVGQLPAIGIFIIRTFGLDTKKFNFNSDAEYLELSEADREEVEIRFDFDKNTIKRKTKQLFRNLGYVYKEHKFICNFIFTIIVILLVYNIYTFIFITNKSYSMEDNYNANGYTYRVNKAYYTDKDGSGNIISRSSDFVIVEVNIKNNDARREINLDNFHLKNGSSEYEGTASTFSREFSDLGEVVDTDMELRRGQSINTLIIFKVDKNKKMSNYVLYYQENGGMNILRKIKLNKIQDVSKINKSKKLNLGEEFNIKMYNVNEKISFDSYEVGPTATYYVRNCSPTSCSREEKTASSKEGYNILTIDFSSIGYEEKKLINFLVKYGKIIYKESDGSDTEIDIENAISNNYYGKILYLQVPDIITEKSSIKIKIVYRDTEYIYKLN